MIEKKPKNYKKQKPLEISQLLNSYNLYVYFRYIKSDQNIIMINLCGSLILSYVIFISAVEQTGNEVNFKAPTASSDI